jgi:hypothetical protein
VQEQTMSSENTGMNDTPDETRRILAQPAAPQPAPGAAACCPAPKQETCCAPSEKATCCGAESTGGGRCGCQ